MTTTITTDNLVGGPASISVAGVDVGATDGVTTIDTSETVHEQFVEQCAMPVGYLLDKMTAKVTGNFAESSAKTSILATGNTTAAVQGAGRNNVGPLQQIVITGPGPSEKTRTITIWKGLFVANTKKAFKRGETTLTPFEIWLAADNTKDEGQKLFSEVDA